MCDIHFKKVQLIYLISHRYVVYNCCNFYKYKSENSCILYLFWLSPIQFLNFEFDVLLSGESLDKEHYFAINRGSFVIIKKYDLRKYLSKVQCKEMFTLENIRSIIYLLIIHYTQIHNEKYSRQHRTETVNEISQLFLST